MHHDILKAWKHMVVPPSKIAELEAMDDGPQKCQAVLDAMTDASNIKSLHSLSSSIESAQRNILTLSEHDHQLKRFVLAKSQELGQQLAELKQRMASLESHNLPARMDAAELNIGALQRKLVEFERAMQSDDPPFARVPLNERDAKLDLEHTVRALGKRVHFAEMERDYLLELAHRMGNSVTRRYDDVLSTWFLEKQQRHCVFFANEKRLTWCFNDRCWRWMGALHSWMSPSKGVQYRFELKPDLEVRDVVVFKEFAQQCDKLVQAVSYQTFIKHPKVAHFRARVHPMSSDNNVNADTQFATILAWDTSRAGMKMVHLVNIWPSRISGHMLKRKHLIEAFVMFKHPEVVESAFHC